MPAPAFRLTAEGPLATEYDNMLACIRCGLCLTSCPTYVLSLHESEGPRGRVGMIRALAEGHLEVTPDLVEHELNCLVCDACSAVCPAGVHMDPMQVALRSGIEPRLSRRWWQSLARRLAFNWLFRDMRSFRLLVRLLWVVQRVGLVWVAARLRLVKAANLLPRLPARFLVPRGETYPAIDSPRQVIAFFAGCVMSTALADVDRATIRVLQRAGCDVTNPAAQGCCGALNAHSGDLEGALDLARRTIAAFEGVEGPVVVNSAGCGAMLKDYGHHLRTDPEWAERAKAFSGRVRDLSEVLAGARLPVARTLDERVVYQDACHLLHAQGVKQQPRDLLRQVPGLELVEMVEAGLCCGSAGVYNLTNPEEAGQLQRRKLDNALAKEPDLIVTANPGCLLHLQAGLRERGSQVRIRHLAEILDEATDG